MDNVLVAATLIVPVVVNDPLVPMVMASPPAVALIVPELVWVTLVVLRFSPVPFRSINP